ncbi:hypothetical protein D3C86_1589500 [compost metagenome]
MCGVVVVVDLREGRCRRLTGCDNDGGVFLFLLELIGRRFEFEVKGGFLGFYFAGREHQQRQAEKGSNATRGQQMALRIKRGRFSRFVGHRYFGFEN